MLNDLKSRCADRKDEDHAQCFAADAVGKGIEKRIGAQAMARMKTNPEDSTSRNSDQIERAEAKRDVASSSRETRPESRQDGMNKEGQDSEAAAPSSYTFYCVPQGRAESVRRNSRAGRIAESLSAPGGRVTCDISHQRLSKAEGSVLNIQIDGVTRTATRTIMRRTKLNQSGASIRGNPSSEMNEPLKPNRAGNVVHWLGFSDPPETARYSLPACFLSRQWKILRRALELAIQIPQR